MVDQDLHHHHQHQQQQQHHHIKKISPVSLNLAPWVLSSKLLAWSSWPTIQIIWPTVRLQQCNNHHFKALQSRQIIKKFDHALFGGSWVFQLCKAAAATTTGCICVFISSSFVFFYLYLCCICIDVFFCLFLHLYLCSWNSSYAKQLRPRLLWIGTLTAGYTSRWAKESKSIYFLLHHQQNWANCSFQNFPYLLPNSFAWFAKKKKRKPCRQCRGWQLDLLGSSCPNGLAPEEIISQSKHSSPSTYRKGTSTVCEKNCQKINFTCTRNWSLSCVRFPLQIYFGFYLQCVQCIHDFEESDVHTECHLL